MQSLIAQNPEILGGKPIIAIRLISQTAASNITNKVLEFISNTKESIIQNSLTIIKDDAANSYQYPLLF